MISFFVCTLSSSRYDICICLQCGMIRIIEIKIAFSIANRLNGISIIVTNFMNVVIEEIFTPKTYLYMFDWTSIPIIAL